MCCHILYIILDNWRPPLESISRAHSSGWVRFGIDVSFVVRTSRMKQTTGISSGIMTNETNRFGMHFILFVVSNNNYQNETLQLNTVAVCIFCIWRNKREFPRVCSRCTYASVENCAAEHSAPLFILECTMHELLIVFVDVLDAINNFSLNNSSCCAQRLPLMCRYLTFGAAAEAK